MTNIEDKQTCCICGEVSKPSEVANIRSNVRKYSNDQFSIWRCKICRSIHAGTKVDLNEYYRSYPFFDKELNWILSAGYRRLLRRIVKAGLKKGDTILDYGCGSGLLVEYLCKNGYDAKGYDPYTEKFADKSVLTRKYNCVIAQDVIEHAEDPLEMMDQLSKHVIEDGIIAIGTPNATGIDLSAPERYVHSLHQPYHLHILSLDALQKAAADKKWQKKVVYMAPYTNMPIISLPFMHHYMKSRDGTLEVLFEQKPGKWFWLNPKTWVLFLFGYFLCNKADVLAIFRKRG